MTFTQKLLLFMNVCYLALFLLTKFILPDGATILRLLLFPLQYGAGPRLFAVLPLCKRSQCWAAVFHKPPILVQLSHHILVTLSPRNRFTTLGFMLQMLHPPKVAIYPRQGFMPKVPLYLRQRLRIR